MIGGKLFFTFAVILLFQYAACDHWSYPDRNSTNVSFPLWGGLCDVGNRQSPIDLSISGALKGNFPDIDYRNYDKPLTSPSLVNNGHTVKLTKFDVEMTMTGGPLNDKFIVEELHLHWWSEHTIDKIRYPMEAHIVHRNTRYSNISEAAAHKDGIAVVGVLFHASNQPNVGIGKIVENIEFINSADDIDKAVTIEQKLNLRELFPRLSGGYLSYPGSLTTPSCAESVTWLVLLDTFPVTLDQVNKFKGVETYGGKKLSDNYRDLQRKNNRPVLVVHQDSSSAPAPINMSAMSLFGSIVVIYISKFLQ
ncbi:carbonic anhydrase 2 [Eupeodes corollae]|uniref:carbonic anhydrase 2 n=1 Tax=Eupeodes corollae TaxID=290404 RepID=UPI0024905171|nr:carbonic anhydrase 2 [Eupeodes corollae]